jgi:hypothetical protein
VMKLYAISLRTACLPKFLKEKTPDTRDPARALRKSLSVYNYAVCTLMDSSVRLYDFSGELFKKANFLSHPPYRDRYQSLLVLPPPPPPP